MMIDVDPSKKSYSYLLSMASLNFEEALSLKSLCEAILRKQNIAFIF